MFRYFIHELKRKKYWIDGIIIFCGILIAASIIYDYETTRLPISEIQESVVENARAPDGSDLIRGNPGAKLFIVEYGDLQCKFCKEFHPYIRNLILNTKYGLNGDVAWVFRNGVHIDNVSVEKAEAIECVRAVEGDSAAWRFIDESIFIVEEEKYPKERYSKIFDSLNIDEEKVNECRINNQSAEILGRAVEEVVIFEIDETPYLQFFNNNGEILFEHTGVLTLRDLEDISEEILQTGY